MNTLILDLGSHSAKAYLRGEKLLEVGAVTWTLLERAKSNLEIENALRRLVEPHRGRCNSFLAIGTEAMRRSPELSHRMLWACRNVGINYRTISQEEEAVLIRRAFPEGAPFDIINVGGGSIQIIQVGRLRPTLLGFGISDLNHRFELNAEPERRKIAECIAWVSEQLPVGLSDFAYTGGEETYLRHLGVPLLDGRCMADAFEQFSDRLAAMTLSQLESLSPRDRKWMHGANASNSIVRACLRATKGESFRPTDINIAHGLLRSIRVEA